jgi:hypothetical protein
VLLHSVRKKEKILKAKDEEFILVITLSQILAFLAFQIAQVAVAKPSMKKGLLKLLLAEESIFATTRFSLRSTLI